jgi:hypothetical protein
MEFDRFPAYLAPGADLSERGPEMESWRVVCVKLGAVNHPTPHTHIIGVGTGDRADWADMRWTFPQVLEAMMEGDVFYTRSETTGRVTPLVTYKCPRCGSTCIRSLEGSVSDNDLDGMRNCVYEMEV